MGMAEKYSEEWGDNGEVQSYDADTWSNYEMMKRRERRKQCRQITIRTNGHDAFLFHVRPPLSKAATDLIGACLFGLVFNRRILQILGHISSGVLLLCKLSVCRRISVHPLIDGGRLLGRVMRPAVVRWG